jgi:DNA-binding transcriptional ArsR family regulator
VLLATTDPQYAREIAARSRTSEPTARKHLRALAATGIADTTATGRGERYERSGRTVAMQRIGDLHARLSREELAAGVEDLRARIQRYQHEYDATDPDDLVLGAEPADDVDWAVVAEWRALDDDRRVAQAALALYDFAPNGGDRDGTSDDDTDSRGAIAREDDSGATA